MDFGVDQLRTELSKRGLPTTGRKTELHERLLGNLLQQSSTPCVNQQKTTDSVEEVRMCEAACERMGKIFDDELLSDVIVQLVDGGGVKELHLHKNVLASACEFFHSMFCTSFKESEEATVTVKVAPNSSLRATEDTLRFLYSAVIVLDGNNVIEVSKLLISERVHFFYLLVRGRY